MPKIQIGIRNATWPEEKHGEIGHDIIIRYKCIVFIAKTTSKIVLWNAKDSDRHKKRYMAGGKTRGDRT